MFMMNMIRPLFEENGISLDASSNNTNGGMQPSTGSSNDPKCALSILTEALNLSAANAEDLI